MTLATGGTVTETGDGYRRHTFTTSADLVVSVAGNVDYLLVGGGGGAGRSNNVNRPSGGGGGGGVKTGVGVALGVATFPIVIGGGGAGFQTDGAAGDGTTGTASTFNSVTAGGGGRSTTPSGNGGAAVNGGGGGGGAGGLTTDPSGGNGVAGGGFNGGAGYGLGTATERAGGGGAGAGEAGTAAGNSVAGDGGDGVQSSLSGVATYYGGGGGGGAASGTVGAGGQGGGAAGRNTASGAGYPNATANTGGGGGGCQSLTTGQGGGNGGSGFAIVRYLSTVTITDAADEVYLNGDAVTVTGTFFIATQGTGRVVISPTDNINDAGAVAQTVTAWGASSINITAVQGSLPYITTCYLFVENDLDASNAAGWPVAFESPVPTITDAGDELYDSGGDPYTITGTNFLGVQGIGSVLISPTDNVNDAGAVTQGVASWSATSINATSVQASLPSGVPLYLFVKNAGLKANAAGFAVQFTFAPVIITDAGDELYANGDAVTITGVGFISVQGGFVTISPTDDITDPGAVVQTVTSWAPTSIGITAVQGALPLATPLYLFVENNVGTSNVSGWAVQFEAAPVPQPGGGFGFIEPIEFIGWIE